MMGVVYFDQLLGAARTQKLVETCDFSREITENSLKLTKKAGQNTQQMGPYF